MSDTQITDVQGVRIAVEGCGHGTLNAIYDSIRETCKRRDWDGVDVLIIGGDFQAVRNAHDLLCMAVPAKYRVIGDFHEYYSGQRTAPYLTIFVGGNHEASNHLFELYYGGWVAPNIYYVGAANVVRLGPLRIAGLSGIWKGYNYKKPHHERLPYSQDDIRSIYHVRELDVRKLLQVRTQVDVAVSHDWPRAVEWYGNHRALFKRKDQFEAESIAGTLGSAAAKSVMDRLRPAFWFAAHLHIRFTAVVTHGSPPEGISEKQEETIVAATVAEDGSIPLPEKDEQAASSKRKRNEEEIDLDMGDSDEADNETATEHAQTANEPAEDKTAEEPEKQRDIVPQSLRDQLPASFLKPTQSSRSNHFKAPPPPPPDITNTTTHFLALDKCLPGRQFLEIFAVEPVSNQPPTTLAAEPAAPLNADSVTTPPASTTTTTTTAPPRFRLEYDKEWLAITRVFASELPALGDRSAAVPANQGEAHYQPLIAQEELWVVEHIMSRPDGMLIPTNFQPIAPVHGGVAAGAAVTPAAEADEQPDPTPLREYPSLQTARFCELVGIANRFWLTEEEALESEVHL
ncbi:MAG: hypothetical protein M1826_005274 [Phylliscum demangeonii]|nr:MAG: hypothetical protein M1826_005274 [Phylliscum demangeonii]